MTPSIIIFSGHMATGKSTLAAHLQENTGALYVNTREALTSQTTRAPRSRQDLQNAGQQLDRSTAGRWVLHLLQKHIHQNPKALTFVVDCIRSPLQLGPIRNKYNPKVTLVHLTCSTKILISRYRQRGDAAPYANASKHPSESKIEDLRDLADLVIDTENHSPQEARELISAHLLSISQSSP